MCFPQFPTDVRVPTCDWCLHEREVQQIERELYRFWLQCYTAVNGRPSIPRKYICQECSTFLDDFSRFMERCQRNDRSRLQRENAEAESEKV